MSVRREVSGGVELMAFNEEATTVQLVGGYTGR